MNTNRKIAILLSGAKGSGKDEFAKYIIEKYPSFERRAFADKLKEKTSQDCKLPLDLFYDENKKEMSLLEWPAYASDHFAEIVDQELNQHFRTQDSKYPTCWKEIQKEPETNRLLLGGKPLYFTPRGLLIVIGSCYRTLNPKYWVNQIQLVPSMVFTDHRYVNEFKDLKEMLGKEYDVITIHIDLEIMDGKQIHTASDASEKSLLDFHFDFRITNKRRVEYKKEEENEKQASILAYRKSIDALINQI